jgi:hypothetical protein
MPPLPDYPDAASLAAHLDRYLAVVGTPEDIEIRFGIPAEIANGAALLAHQDNEELLGRLADALESGGVDLIQVAGTLRANRQAIQQQLQDVAEVRDVLASVEGSNTHTGQ